VIELVKPKVVVLELCQTRVDEMKSNRGTEARGVKDFVEKARKHGPFRAIGKESVLPPFYLFSGEDRFWS